MKLLRRDIIRAESDENMTKSARYISENPMDQIEKAFISELEAEKSRAAEPQTTDNRHNEEHFSDVEIIVVDSPRSSAMSRQASGTRQPDNTKKNGEDVSEVRYSNEWHVESQMLEDLSDAKNMKDF